LIQELIIMDALSQTLHDKPFCRIRGRLISKRDLHQKIANLCEFHGERYDAGCMLKMRAERDITSQLAGIGGLPRPRREKNSAVILLLEAKVPYETNWGGFGSIPCSVLNMPRKPLNTETTSGFIEPYLTQYRNACRAVHLGCDGNGKYSISVPDFLCGETGGNANDHQLLYLKLEKLVERNNSGILPPVSVNGSCRNYVLSDAGVRKFSDAGFAWTPDRSVSVGPHLPADVLAFKAAADPTAEGLLTRVLMPVMAMIVSDPTPQLRAAEVLLQNQLGNLIDRLHKKSITSDCRIFCIAGLNIDMSVTPGSEKAAYFIPWKAHLYRRMQGDEDGSFEQEELFAELMGQSIKNGPDASSVGET